MELCDRGWNCMGAGWNLGDILMIGAVQVFSAFLDPHPCQQKSVIEELLFKLFCSQAWFIQNKSCILVNLAGA